ncbi:type VI secretion system protein TssA [Pelistega sp. MC2]|uniref:type VI secretion system protein TssA n=1 Tax=Pelistega sp. MC2 TaxID=1720297 RepID=UPI0008DB1FCC|nr:type VI secretion system protein TssA [Pelistega sp. MC2]
MMTFEELFAQFSNTDCGSNLEYDADFLSLNQLAQLRPEQQFGNTIIEAQAPDWSKVENLAISLCARTCDLRILAILTWAWTAQRGIIGYAQGLTIVRHALNEFWDAVYPLVVEDDGYEDPMPRMNTILALVDLQSIVPSLKQSLILTESYEKLTLRDAEQIIEGNRADDFPGGKVRLGQMLYQGKQSSDPLVLAIEEVNSALEQIKELVAEKLGFEWAPDFKGVSELFKSLVGLLENVESSEDEESTDNQVESGNTVDVVTDAESAPATESIKVTSWREVQIKTRADAMLALEKASAYFEVFEPSHPAPFLIKRVQQTIPLNFYEMLKNLTPNSHEQFDMWLPKEED